jgi:hypothetical protein
MPFCSKCGTEVPENINFCQKCGNSLQSGQSGCNGNETTGLSDKWAWTLACIPILNLVDAGWIIFIILNTIFAILDIKELKKEGHNPGSWIWLGLFLIPVYLFIRASKTNEKYGYAITWCALFVLTAII